MKTPDVRLRVAGVPITQGSKNKSRAGHIFDDNAKTLKPWRRTLKESAEAAVGPGWQPLIGPLRVELLFAFPRPASHPKKRRTWPTHHKDADKLARACLDALTDAKIWRDDGQVVDLRAVKDWCGPAVEQNTPGVVISITRIETDPTT